MSRKITAKDGQTFTFPDNLSPEQIKAVLDKHYANQSAPPMMMTAQNNPLTSAASGLKRGALGLLPAAGGLVGGMAGAGLGGMFFGVPGIPAGIEGAAYGGAIGENMRRTFAGEPQSVSATGGAAAGQAAFQAGGGLMAKGAGAVARPLMKRALGAGKSIMSEFPDVVETTLRRGVSVSGAGAAKATALREKSSLELIDILNKAKAGGTTFRTYDVARRVRTMLRSPVLPDKDKARIMGQLVDFLNDKGKTIEPVLLKEIKQFYQARAKSVYLGARTGIPTLAQENRAKFSGAIAEGAREQLERIPGVAAREAETQSLIGAERAIKDATMRPPGQIELLKPLTYPVINNPNVMSRVALTLNAPLFKSLLRQSPRAAAALLMEMMYTDQPDKTRVVP